jgi:predicted house-cleaning NTP pyrophosphatase (Maf/HAM1 superfamily)
MLLPYLTLLNTKKVILGSQSKARHDLLQTQVHISFILAINIRKNSKHIPRGPRQEGFSQRKGI